MTPLPDGFVVRLAPSVTVRDGGRTLIGGAPLRVSHLSPAARDLLASGDLTVSDATTRALAGHLLAAGLAEPVIERLAKVPLDLVTCVVPVRDRPDSLERLLAPLRGRIQVVVVDDASLEPGPVRQAAERHGAGLIVLDHNIGPAGARNIGLRAVTTPYVLFVDSDVVIRPVAIARLLKHFHDPSVALVAPRIRGRRDSTGWIADYEATHSSLDRGSSSGAVRPGSGISWVPSAALAGRVEALPGGFDASMRVGEDVDLVWRLDASGWRVRYDAEALAEHEHRTTCRAWLGRKFAYGTSAADLAARHGATVAPAALTAHGAALSCAVLAQRRWSAPISLVVAGFMLRRMTRTVSSSDRPLILATELTAQGVGSVLTQLSGLLLRHWWPAAAAGCLVSRRLRRAVIVASVVDVVRERQRSETPLSWPAFAVARRLDDAAYGVGVAAGAMRAGSVRALLPRWVRGA